MNVQPADLCRVAKEVLETIAFVFVAQPPRGGPPVAEEQMSAVVGFDGSSTGAVRLVLPTSAAREMAATMLGLDSQDSLRSGQVADAVGELANVIAGNLLRVMAGPTAIFRLSSPAARHHAAGEASIALADPEGAASQTGTLFLESGWVELSVVWKEACPA